MSGYRTLHREEPDHFEDGSIIPVWSVSFADSNVFYAATAAGYVKSYCIRSKSATDNDSDILDARGLHLKHFSSLMPFESKKDCLNSSLMLCQVKAVSLDSSDSGGVVTKHLVCAISIDGKILVWEHEFEKDKIEFDTNEVKKHYFQYVYNYSDVTGTSLALQKYNNGDYHAAVGCRDGSILIVNVTTEKENQWEKIEGKDAADCVMSLAWSNCGMFLASGHQDGIVNVFKKIDSDGGGKRFYFKRLYSIAPHRECVRAITFTKDSYLLLTGSDDSIVQTFDIQRASGKAALTGSYECHESWVLGIASHSDSKRFVTAGGDKKIKVWDLTMRDCVHTFDGVHSDKVWALTCSHDGNRVVSCGDDGKIVIYSCEER